MNKQKAIEKIKNLNARETFMSEIIWVKRDDVLDIIKQLDEPEKPVIPKYVADWIEWCKKNNATLLGAISPIDELGTAICDDKKVESLDASRWATRNQETFAKAWLFGYEIEKEKLYLASFRDTNQYLGWNEKLGEWFMSCSPFTSGVEQTQETWEGVGIWNNPAFEIKEVEE